MTDIINLNDVTKKYEKILKPKIFELIKKIDAKYDELNENRYWLTIYFSDDDSKNKILVILINPSDDKTNSQTLNKLIKHFSSDLIYSLTIINLFSTIAPQIKKNDKELINKILSENEENINIIKEKVNEENYNKCIIGCGQHLIGPINECRNKCIDRYIQIIDIIINKDINTFDFGKLVYKNKLPIHPGYRKLEFINDRFNIVELDLNLLYKNLQKLKK